MKKLNLIKATIYPKDELGGDYLGIRLIDTATAKTVREWGDAYHDRGDDKAQGYIEALQDQGLLGSVDEMEIESLSEHEIVFASPPIGCAKRVDGAS